jgi:hypothetical protein
VPFYYFTGPALLVQIDMDVIEVNNLDEAHRLGQLAGPCPSDGVTHSRLADSEGSADLTFGQPQGVLMTQDFSYLSHEQSLFGILLLL